MEVLVPFMLFILGISEDDPTQIQLSRHPVLYENEKDCLGAGRQVIRSHVLQEHQNGTYFRVFCKKVPRPEEYETLFSELQADRKNLPVDQDK